MNADSSIQRYRYIHLATHGFLGMQIEDIAEPCLALSIYGDPTDDGFLKMSEIFGLNLDADMVVLSACNTGAVEGNEARSEGLSGLARAFFFAGTPRLTVTLWSIADESTVKLMKSYYQRLKDRDDGRTHISTLDALRQAKIEMIDGGTYSHPFYWAPFILLGEWK